MLSGWWAVLPRWWAEGARGAKGRRLLSHWRSLGQLLSLLLLLLLPLLLTLPGALCLFVGNIPPPLVLSFLRRLVVCLRWNLLLGRELLLRFLLFAEQPADKASA